jgi:O-methyltransferase involved in polyketide biosynthesis
MDLNDLANNPEQIKQLISALQSLLPKNNEITEKPAAEEELDNPVENTEEFTNKAIKTKSSKKFIKREASSNKFLSMPERNMFKEDSKIDKLLNKHPPVERSREFSLVKVTCRVCGKTEEINPALAGEATSRYKCNNCSTSAG